MRPEVAATTPRKMSRLRPTGVRCSASTPKGGASLGVDGPLEPVCPPRSSPRRPLTSFVTAWSTRSAFPRRLVPLLASRSDLRRGSLRSARACHAVEDSVSTCTRRCSLLPDPDARHRVELAMRSARARARVPPPIGGAPRSRSTRFRFRRAVGARFGAFCSSAAPASFRRQWLPEGAAS